MCGIFFYQSKKDNLSVKDIDRLIINFNKIQHRGPDNSNYIIVNDNTFIGFHRLSINDVSENGNQPFVFEDNDSYCICNGEIYNYLELSKKYNVDLKTSSDCEVLFPVYKKIGIEKLCNEIDGVYSFLIFEKQSNKITFARDIIGVRPMFYFDNENELIVSSEGKAIYELNSNFSPFPPASYYENGIIKMHTNIDTWFNYQAKQIDDSTMEELYSMIRKTFDEGIEKRMLSDREIGCLLSGGLDSSIVAAILQKKCKERGKNLRTYSIGFKDATDLINAKRVANYIGSEHHEVIITKENALNSLHDVVRTLESWDTTTVRASTGMYLLSKYISELGKDIVIFSGEGSDELMQGYLYFHYAPNHVDARKESNRLMNDLYMYDVLRADRTTANFGLELRVPFLDKDFMKLMCSIPCNIICPLYKAEKYLFRKAFDSTELLPKDILWRTKEAFSDGVSSKEDSWHNIIKNNVDNLIEINNFDVNTLDKHLVFNSSEEKYYRLCYEHNYSGNNNLLNYYWMPKWIKLNDPSARELDIYNKDDCQSNNQKNI